MSILIKNAEILTMTEMALVPEKGDVLIEDDKISAVGAVDASDAERATDVIDATGMVAMPGLVNCHNHAAMSLLRGFSEDLRLMEWLSQKIWPAEARLTEEDVYLGTMLAAAEMIKSGTTTFNDMYVFMDSVAKAVEDSGMRAVLARGLIDLPDKDAEARWAEARDLVERWHGEASGRITTMIGPHGPHTCPPAYMERAMELADELDSPLHIHLAETTEEVDIVREKYHLTPTEYLRRCGLLDFHLVLAHSVHLTESDIEILGTLEGGVSHNPVSNFKLGCGVAPVPEYLQNGTTVGLGTDGPGSCTTLDMFEEIKAAAWMQKNRTFDPTALNASQVLHMATREGAKVLSLDHVGTLEVGKQADLILIDHGAAHLSPNTDLVALLAYGANGADVDTTIVNGNILMRERRLLTIDEGELVAKVQVRVPQIIQGI